MRFVKTSVRKDRLVYANHRGVLDAVLKNNAIIAGGYARYVQSCRMIYVANVKWDESLGYAPCPVWNESLGFSDIDIFATTQEGHDELVKFLHGLDIDLVSDTDKALTFRDEDTKLTYQLIKFDPKLDTPEKILSEFDFTVCRVAIISKTEALEDHRFDDDDLEGKLAIVNEHTPFQTTCF